MATFSYTLTALGANQAPGTAQGQEELLLGKDILFDGDYHVGPTGDWVLLSGLDALRQAIYRRLMVRPGEYRVRPEYGVGVMDFVKKRRLPTTVDELRQRIVDQLSLDERIDEVLDVVVENIQDGLQVGVVIRAAGKSLKFEPFDFREGKTLGTLTNAQRGLRIN